MKSTGQAFLRLEKYECKNPMATLELSSILLHQRSAMFKRTLLEVDLGDGPIFKIMIYPFSRIVPKP